MDNKKKIKKFFIIIKEQYKNSDLSDTSVIIAYYTLLSLFPVFIIIGNIMPLFHIDPDMILDHLNYFIPSSIIGVLDPIIGKLLTDTSVALISVSSLGLFWSASRGISYLEKGINKAYGFTGARSGILQRILSFFIFIGVLLYIIAIVLIFDLGTALLKELIKYDNMLEPVYQLFSDIKWPLTIFALVFLIVLIYSLVPATKVKLRDSLPGTLFTVAGWVILMESFSLYVRFSGRLNLYGALSSVFILIFWLNFAVMLVLCGAMLNASIQRYRYGDLIQKESKVQNKIKSKATQKLSNIMKK